MATRAAVRNEGQVSPALLMLRHPSLAALGGHVWAFNTLHRLERWYVRVCLLASQHWYRAARSQGINTLTRHRTGHSLYCLRVSRCCLS